MTEKLQPNSSAFEPQPAITLTPDFSPLELIIPDPHQCASDSLGHSYCFPNSGPQDSALNFSGENPTDRHLVETEA